MIAQDHATTHRADPLPSGRAELDALLGGGIDHGTGTMLLGPAGTGKSTLAMQYVTAAADRGERAALFLFDERPRTLLARLDGLGIGLRRHLESGVVTIQQVDPAELSPGEFTGIVQEAVDPAHGQGASVVVIDSLNGYMQAMPEERFLIIQLHELLTFLGRRGVATFMVVAQQGLVGTNMQAPFDATYLADTVILLRYFEADGEIQQAISVVKRRTGDHERTIRRFSLSDRGLHVGEPLVGFHGLLTGVPVRNGSNGDGAHSNS
jgi:circadian clock protein KaiC